MSRSNGIYAVPPGWTVFAVDQIKAKEPSACVAGPFGSKISAKYFVDEGVPVIRGSNLRDDLTRFVPEGFVFVSEQKAREYGPQHVRASDLVFTCWGTIGQVGIIPEDGPYPEYIISNKQLKLRVDRSVANPLFCFYYFASPAGVQYIRNRGIGGAVPGINLGILKALPIALPSIAIQERIAGVLSAYDDLIANNRRRIDLLNGAVSLLYREWFVHFRFPGHEHVEIIDGLPKGWTMEPLSRKAEAVMGQSPPSKFYNESGQGLPFHQGVKDYGDRFPSHRVYCTRAERVAQPGDILFSVRAPVGRINIARDKLVIGRGLAALRASDGHQAMLYYQLRAHFHKEDMIGTGAIYAAVTKKDLFAVRLVKAPLPLVEAFESIARDADRQIEVLTLQIWKLQEARDVLLPKLLSGEVEV